MIGELAESATLEDSATVVRVIVNLIDSGELVFDGTTVRLAQDPSAPIYGSGSFYEAGGIVVSDLTKAEIADHAKHGEACGTFAKLQNYADESGRVVEARRIGTSVAGFSVREVVRVFLPKRKAKP